MSLLDYSTTDYVLRSVNVLFFPVIGVIVASLAALWLHHRIEARLTAPRRGRGADLALAAGGWAWLWLPLLLGGALAAVAGTALVALVPFVLTAGLGAALYTGFLRVRIGTRRPPGRLWVGLVVALVVVLLFWDVQRIAAAFGTEYAKYVKADPSQFSTVALLSSEPLNLAPYDVAVSDTGPDTGHRYRYDGFWLLTYANSRYFLMARTPTGDTAVVVVPDTDSLQLAFAATRTGS
ncbi:hypothetical protein E8D34_19100 [Nocardioides sp. GY 10113]|nr:hypothetical protein E8D34_19100 [Nocardioides sp. GY 10113]